MRHSRGEDSPSSVEKQALLDACRSSGWFSRVGFAGTDEAADLRLDVRLEREEIADDQTEWVAASTLSVIPGQFSVTRGLILRVLDPGGRVLGEVARAERFVVRRGWPMLLLGSRTRAGAEEKVIRDLMRAALAEARLRGWL